jgi:hypothetical protein
MILLTVFVLFVAVPLFIGCLSLVDDPIPDMERILDTVRSGNETTR